MQLKCLNILLKIYILIKKKKEVIILEINKIVKLKINNENLKEIEKLLAIWRYSIIQKRKGINIEDINILTTYQVSLNNFNGFNIPAFHPIVFNTGFSIDFENSEVKLTSLERYHRILLKIDEEDMEHLKKEINNGAKATEVMIIPPSYLKGHHRRREIVKNKHWKLHITLKKNIELLTKEEFRKLQRIAVIGVDLNSKYGVAYSLWIWNVKENSIKPIRARFLPKMKSHQFQELEKQRLQEIHKDSVKYNELFQRINRKIQRQNIAWIEKMSKMLIDIALESIKQYNCEIAVISFEDLKDYKAGNNSKKINKKNTEWLRGRIVQRVFEKSLWNYSMKVLTYLPTYNKNQRNLEQILVDANGTTIYCSKCGSKGKLIKYIAKGKIKKFFKCNNCGYSNNKHFNAGNNIVKKAIEYLKKVASSDASELRRS
jgi:dihydroneopterin aldolase/transcription elongation factor Elf1